MPSKKNKASAPEESMNKRSKIQGSEPENKYAVQESCDCVGSDYCALCADEKEKQRQSAASASPCPKKKSALAKDKDQDLEDPCLTDESVLDQDDENDAEKEQERKNARKKKEQEENIRMFISELNDRFTNHGSQPFDVVDRVLTDGLYDLLVQYKGRK